MVLFGFFSLILVAIYWINSTVKVFDRLISDGQSSGVVLAYTALSLPLVIAIVLPMSAFGATAYVTNRMSSESELVVVQATGFGPFRTARPFLYFGLIVAAMCAVLLNFLVPTSVRIAAIQQEQLARNVTAQFLTPGQFIHPVKGVTFYISEVTSAGVLRGLFLTDARSPETRTTYMAREAYLLAEDTGPRLVMVDGMAQMLKVADRRLAVTRFDDFTYDVGRLITAVRPPTPTPRQLSTAALLRADPEQIATLGSSIAQFEWEANNRITQSLLAVVAVMIGFSTLLIGAFSRFGIWRQILAAIALMVVVKMLDNAVTGYARNVEGGWPIMYLPLIAGAVMSLGLLIWSGLERKRPPGRPEEIPQEATPA